MTYFVCDLHYVAEEPEHSVVLPFLPFVGLQLKIPSLKNDSGKDVFMITEIGWDSKLERFSCEIDFPEHATKIS